MVVWFRTWSVVLVLACSLAGIPGGAFAVDDRAALLTSADDTSMATSMGDALDAVGARGGAWIVVDRDGTAHAGSAGTDGDGRPFSPDTPVLIGSVSKPIAAAVAMDLAAKGALDLDRPVVDMLPRFRTEEARRLRVTPRHLLAHTSGLPFGADLLDIAGQGRTPASVVEQIRAVRLETEPGERYAYSSLGYVVLAAALEQVTGRHFGDLVAARFPAAGLLTTPAQAQRIPPGQRSPFLPVPQTAPYDPAGLAYGYIGGSVRSLAEVGRASLTDRRGLAAMTDVDPPAGRTLTGLGWRVNDDPAGRLVWHTGTVPGYFTALFVLPRTGQVVAFVANRSGALDDRRMYAASHRLVDIVRGEEPSAIPLPVSRWALIGAVVLCAVVAGLLGTRRRLSLRAMGVAVGAAATFAPWIAAAIADVPVRYLWLWVPEVWSASAVGVPVLVALSLRLARRPATPTPGGRTSERSRTVPVERVST